MTKADILLIALTIVLFLIGTIGCIIPGIPGTPICWGGMLASYFVSRCSITTTTLIICAIVTVAVEILNNFVPGFFTSKAGGSKAGSVGATVGVFAGAFTGGFAGILAGPFLGALIGEFLHDSSNLKRAVKSAAFAFLGFITGTGMRLIVALAFIIVVVRAFFVR